MNPDPSQTVVYGPRTKDEMCEGGMWVTVPAEEWASPMIVSKGRRVSGGGIRALSKEDIAALRALSKEDIAALQALSEEDRAALRALKAQNKN